MSKYIDDYLAHHGILGQKWGRKNGPPYPLDASDHSSSEKKAGWRKSLDGGSDKEIKKKAKQYEKNINAVQASRLRTATDLRNNEGTRTRVESRMKALEFKGKTDSKKYKKLQSRVDELNTKIEKQIDHFNKTTDEYKKLVEELKKDKSLVYRTFQTEETGEYNDFFRSGLASYNKALADSENDARGKATLLSAITLGSGYDVTYTGGTGYRVREATERRKKSNRWNNKRQQYGLRPTKVTTYVY